MTIGPVPFTATLAWASHHELDRDATNLLWEVIKILDGERYERQASERRLKNIRGGS